MWKALSSGTEQGEVSDGPEEVEDSVVLRPLSLNEFSSTDMVIVAMTEETAGRGERAAVIQTAVV